MSETQSRLADADIEPRHVSGVVVGAVVLALYASWMAADVVARSVVFPIVALAAGYLLYKREEPGKKTVYVGYSLAKLLVITPFVMILPDLFGDFTAGPAEMGLTMANLLLVVVFLLPAAGVAYVTYRYDGGRGIVQRVRDRV